MLSPPKIRMPNGKWYTPRILEGQGGFCHQCGGLLVDHENDGYEARRLREHGSMVETERDRPPEYRIKPVTRKLPEDVFICLGCGVKMKLTEIPKPVLIAKPQ